MTEWIPPKQPLAGDVGQSFSYTHVKEDRELKNMEIELQELEKQEQGHSENDNDTGTQNEETVDWLKTRRAMLSGKLMVKPGESTRVIEEMTDVPVIMHTLLTRREITTSIEMMGGKDVACVLDNPESPKMGGAKGIMIVTVDNHPHMRTMAEMLVRQLRNRKLEEVGVVGAKLGIEGSVNDPHENWMVVDCGSYVVHFQTGKVRRALDLEGLWSGRDGMHKVDFDNDDEVEDYVASHPIPDDYWVHSAVYDWEDTMKSLEKTRYSIRKPSNVQPRRKRKRGGLQKR
jgi:ribosomal silencing factor RsfS